MGEMDLILEDTFFETYTVDVRHKPMQLVVCCNDNKLTVKLTMIPKIRGGKLILVSIDQKTNEQKVVVVQMQQLQRTHEEAKNNGPPPKYICKVLGRYKHVFTNGLLQKLPPTREVDHKIEVILGSKPPSKGIFFSGATSF